MNTTVSQDYYVAPWMITECVKIFRDEMKNFQNIKEHLINVLDFDDSPDLTEVHPKDRTNVSIYVIFLYDHMYAATEEIQKKFSKTRNYVQTMPGVNTLKCIAIGPNSIVPLHLDDMNREPYDLNNWYSVFTGVIVPSEDANLIGIKIDNDIYSHAEEKSIIFDTQIPHCAWNNTDQWWISLRFSTSKENFQNVNIIK
jgi:hypothetical protein